MLITIVIKFTLFTPFKGVKGVNSANPSYLHYLNRSCKIGGVNNQIEHINIPDIERGTIDHSNPGFLTKYPGPVAVSTPKVFVIFGRWVLGGVLYSTF